MFKTVMDIFLKYRGNDLMASRPQFQVTPRRFSVGGVMNACPGHVWRVITDTSLWTEWGPSIVKVNCNGRFISYGCKGAIITVIGVSLKFTITYLEKETEWTWAVGGINATGHRIVPINDDCCMLFFDMPIWAIPYSLVCLVALHRIKKIITSIQNTDVKVLDPKGKK